MSGRMRVFAIELLIAVVVAGTIAFFVLDDGPPPKRPGGTPPPLVESTTDPIERGCGLSDEVLLRIWRGHDPAHSEDVTTVPLEPNYSGTFNITSHSGPWDYLQQVPLVFYGPGRITASGEPIAGAAGLEDVYSTIGALVGVPLQERSGRVLDEAIEPKADGRPKLVVGIVWDGGGRSLLERWPDAWPNLARLEAEGTSFVDATVGSSPSITPATHSTLGTGMFPRDHGVTAIEYRSDRGVVRSAFAGRRPQDLHATTFIDDIDAALDNEPIAGMLAWRQWHMGMLSHGTATPGGDADQLALISSKGGVGGNDDFYSTPIYMDDFVGDLDGFLAEADRSDGAEDGKWLGSDLHEFHDNPGWIRYQTELILTMLDREGYGRDDSTDFFMTNYKPTDIVGHQFTMDSPEMEGVLRAQDDALGDILEWLDANVGDYVLILTADHSVTPSARRSGAWPILQGQLRDDVDAHFGIPANRDLIDTTTAVGPFLNPDVAAEFDVTAEQIAEFLNAYTIEQNWNADELPEDFRDRGAERVFEAAFASSQLDEVMRCRFGSTRPPKDLTG